MTPTCYQHPDRSASQTCERCGNFVCSECIGFTEYCSPCLEKMAAEAPSAQRRGAVACAFLIAAVAVRSGQGALAVATDSLGQSTGVVMLTGLWGLVFLVVEPGTIISFLIWMHAAVRRATLLGRAPGATPAWAVGSWFVPFVNLVVPFQVVRRLLGEPEASGVRSFVPGLWWACWLGSGVVSWLSLLDRRDGALAFKVLANTLAVVAGLLLVSIVRGVNRASSTLAASAG
jgi:hypothetical protein